MKINEKTTLDEFAENCRANKKLYRSFEYRYDKLRESLEALYSDIMKSVSAIGEVEVDVFDIGKTWKHYSNVVLFDTFRKEILPELNAFEYDFQAWFSGRAEDQERWVNIIVTELGKVTQVVKSKRGFWWVKVNF
jgi:hypothetical protein